MKLTCEDLKYITGKKYIEPSEDLPTSPRSIYVVVDFNITQ